jgi:hypothetical protein
MAGAGMDCVVQQVGPDAPQRPEGVRRRLVVAQPGRQRQQDADEVAWGGQDLLHRGARIWLADKVEVAQGVPNDVGVIRPPDDVPCKARSEAGNHLDLLIAGSAGAK